MNRSLNGRKPSVLIAEDDPDDRTILKLAFHDACSECEIRFVHNGEDLLDYLRHQGKYADLVPPKPAVILLDLGMPKLDGREALVEIRKCSNFKDTPVIVWTTSSTVDDRDFSLKQGASAFFTKPSKYLDLQTAIHEIVKGWLHPIIS